MERPEGKPSRLREVRNEVVEAISKLVKEAEKYPPTDRAAILKEAALGISALDQSLTAWIAARAQMERR